MELNAGFVIAAIPFVCSHQISVALFYNYNLRIIYQKVTIKFFNLEIKMTILTDTHAHLYSTKFEEDRAAMIERAINEGVEYLFLPNVDKNSIQPMYDLVAQFPRHCFPMMGLHPCSVKDDYEQQLETAKKELFSSGKKFYGVGETGLDYYWDLTFKEQQKEALRTQIRWAKETGLPIILHCRESFEDTYEIIKSMNDEQLSGIFHCFTGSESDAQKVIDLGGFFLGIGGVVTFKNGGLDKTLENISLEHMVLETDAPYLSPTPKRGKRNESAYLMYVARKLADVKNVSLKELAAITTKNARKVFNLN